MKIALIAALIFTFAGCATNQPSSSRSQIGTNGPPTDQFDHPELAGMTKDEISHLLWRSR